MDMKSSAPATTGTRSAAGRHAGSRHPQDWQGAGHRAQGRHAQRPNAPYENTPAAHVAFARRFAVSMGAAAAAAIVLPEAS
jgi:hypothetical protein